MEPPGGANTAASSRDCFAVLPRAMDASSSSSSAMEPASELVSREQSGVGFWLQFIGTIDESAAPYLWNTSIGHVHKSSDVRTDTFAHTRMFELDSSQPDFNRSDGFRSRDNLSGGPFEWDPILSQRSSSPHQYRATFVQ